MIRIEYINFWNKILVLEDPLWRVKLWIAPGCTRLGGCNPGDGINSCFGRPARAGQTLHHKKIIWDTNDLWQFNSLHGFFIFSFAPRRGIIPLCLPAVAGLCENKYFKKLLCSRSRQAAKEFILCSSPRKVGRQGVNSLRLCALAS